MLKSLELPYSWCAWWKIHVSEKVFQKDLNILKGILFCSDIVCYSVSHTITYRYENQESDSNNIWLMFISREHTQCSSIRWKIRFFIISNRFTTPPKYERFLPCCTANLWIPLNITFYFGYAQQHFIACAQSRFSHKITTVIKTIEINAVFIRI